MYTTQHKHTNPLIQQSSPYLLQHAHNPVNWYPWGMEALEKAKNENKLILISIGYAACHWCHVMEHESFENEQVADFMNEHFVSIKVDREERPDIDQVYMNAVQLLSGRGGWPLNCVALPDGRPIYGGTYFTKAEWLDMLAKVADFVTNYPEKAEQQAKTLTDGVQNTELIYSSTAKHDVSIDDLDAVFENWKKEIDYVSGGTNAAPKFPLPSGHQFLLHYYHLTNNTEALKAVIVTLDKMAEGGIYDQVGGGFSRYSVDAVWKVPHFEKMLYDNAQLVSLYCATYQQTKNPVYKQIVLETLAFVQRELTSPDGGFYASLDADSEGVEGKFYVWTYDELETMLGSTANIINDYYSVTQKGNWEKGQNIFHRTSSDLEIAQKYSISETELNKLVLRAKQIVLNERTKRVRPGLDDKLLTSWNALMIKGYIDAYRVFDVKEYMKIALKNAEFILSNIKDTDYCLSRNFKNGNTTINGFLDDYAFTIQAFISIYQATFDQKWLTHAQQLTDYTLTHFYDTRSGMFYYTSDVDPSLIARKMELSDNVIPSSNSEMAKNLFILGHYLYNDDYIEKAKQMLNNIKENAIEHGTYYANWDILMAWMTSEPYEIAIVGDDCETNRKEFDSHYLPNVFFSGGITEGNLEALTGKLIEGETTIYVCRDKQCQRPVNEVSEALKLVR